jgi:hypothetical protein
MPFLVYPMDHGEDKELVRTAAQRALGFKYETQKAFQTGVVVTIEETVPPDPGMLRWLLANHQPQFYSDKTKHEHIVSADDAFLKFLESEWKRGQTLSDQTMPESSSTSQPNPARPCRAQSSRNETT